MTSVCIWTASCPPDPQRLDQCGRSERRLQDGETSLLATFDHHLGGRRRPPKLGDDERETPVTRSLSTAGHAIVGW